MRHFFLFFALFFLLCSGGISSSVRAADSWTQKAMSAVARARWDEALAAARASGNPHVISAVRWYQLNRADELPDFSVYEQFLNSHRDWPGEDKLLTRAEIALLGNHHPDSTIAAWLKRHPPQTAFGRYMAAKFAGKLTDTIIKDTWIHGDFTPTIEQAFLARCRAKLGRDLHIRRTDRLLWESKISAAQRMFPLLSEDYRKLFDARIKLMTQAHGVDGYVNRVPAALSHDIGLLFERMRFRASKGNYAGVEELLLGVPRSVPYPARWWPYRQRAIRDALDARNFTRAYQLAAAHGQTDRMERSEALWLKGWIALVFRNGAKEALADFSEMFTIVSYPISRSRAAYWAGRAASALGRKKEAASWYGKAARWPTTFYGQLALSELSAAPKLSIPWPSAPKTSAVSTTLNATELGRTVLALGNAGAVDQAWPFILHLVEKSSSADAARNVVNSGFYFQRVDLSVRASKEAQRVGYNFTESGFPVPDLPKSLAVEPAYALAIMRQESLFNPRAMSVVGARGLMQLMPATARVIARRHGMSYSESRLFEAGYNIPLGSYYLRELLERFNGSHILATAGYNAGPSRPAAWREKFGVPGGDFHQTINWIEMIPYAETRNYVQRVLENQQVYRYLLAKGKTSLTLKETLSGR